MRFPGFLEKAVTLSYDDGRSFDKRLIEIMSKNGIKGTFNLNSNNYLTDSFPIKAEELKEIYLDTGNEIAVHGVDHLSLALTDPGEATHSIVADRERIYSVCGELKPGIRSPYIYSIKR